MVFNGDGFQWVRSRREGPAADPVALGAEVAGDLLRQGADRLITATRV
jgi:hydroxymethylbilane synthase